MTLQAMGRVVYPDQIIVSGAISAGLGAVAITFDSQTDRLAWVGRAFQSDSIASVSFRTGTVTLGDTLELRIETVSNGKPTGTLWSANSTGANPNGTVAVADADDNVWKTVTLTNAAILVPGDEFAIVIVWSAESGGAGINMQFAASETNLKIAQGQYPLLWQDTGAGTWAAVAGNVFEWIVTMTTAGPVMFPGLSPLNGAGTITSFNSGSSPNERALKLIIPFKCRATGMRVAMFNIAAGADFLFSIWDSTDDPGAGPTPLAQTNTQDGDAVYSTSQDGYIELPFVTPATLSANSTVYLGVKPTTANSIGIGELTTATVTNAIRSFGIGAVTACLSTRVWASTDPGAWTDTATTFPMIHLVIDQLDDGAGGGSAGMLYRPNMAGT